MFDANLRDLPQGYKFFAELKMCKEGSKIYNNGFRKGDVLLCEMMDEPTGTDELRDNPTIKIYKNKGKKFFFCKSWEDGEKLFSHLLVYSGSGDLTDFLPQEGHILEKAKLLLEEYKL